MVWAASNSRGQQAEARSTQQKPVGLGSLPCLTRTTSKRTTKGTVAQLYLGSVTRAAREARAGFGRRVAVTSPQPDFKVLFSSSGFEVLGI